MIDTDHDHMGALEMGTAYALLRHGQDVQTDELIEGLRASAPPAAAFPDEITVRIDDTDRQATAPAQLLDLSSVPGLGWDKYIGQEPLKRQLQVRCAAAKRRGEPLPHVLLASNDPGVGKTKAGRNIAKTMGCSIAEMMPPFTIETLAEVATQLLDGDVLLIEEIHKLKDRRRGDEILLKALEEFILYMPNGEIIPINHITIIGTTTDADLLGEPVLDRFRIKPFFQPYTRGELARIVVAFAEQYDALQWLTPDLCVDIGDASRGTPRLIEEIVSTLDDLAMALGRGPTSTELLDFMEIQPDGLNRHHIKYLTALRQYYGRPRGRGDEKHIEYVAGQATMMTILRDTKTGVGRIERYLTQLGLLDNPSYGRRLTPRGVKRAEEFIARGLGAADV